MLVGGITHYGHTNFAAVGHGLCLPASSQAVTFARLLVKICLGDMGCLCSIVCFCFGCDGCLEGVLLSQLSGELDALLSGKQLQMLGDPA